MTRTSVLASVDLVRGNLGLFGRDSDLAFTSWKVPRASGGLRPAYGLPQPSMSLPRGFLCNVRGAPLRAMPLCASNESTRPGRVPPFGLGYPDLDCLRLGYPFSASGQNRRAVCSIASLGPRVRSRALYPWSTRKMLETLRKSVTGTVIVTAIVRIIGGMEITDPITDLTMAIG